MGNIGPNYAHTRHNIGFQVLDALASASNILFKDGRYAYTAEYKYKGRIFLLVKPTTFMNLSGSAVNYWLKAEKIPLENLLVVVDDLALPFGVLRLRGSGNDGGHNGLSHINQVLGSQDYARLRFGIGNEFSRGRQIDYVLGEWNSEEKKELPERMDKAIEIIQSFGSIGLQFTMNQFNNK